jgi:hypothetical protein
MIDFAATLGNADGELVFLTPLPPDISQAPLHSFLPCDFLLGCLPCNRLAILIFLVANWVSDLIDARTSDDRPRVSHF